MTGPGFVMSALEMADAFGGTLLAGDPGTPLPEVSIDSRSLVPGALFVALRGPRFDGHAFVADARARGAAGVVISEDPGALMAAGIVVIRVPDSLRGLQQAAQAVRRRAGTRLVAITGSAGKTTTKDITATLLAPHLTTFRAHGNLNNHIGLPLSLFQLRTQPDIGVVELGMSGFGEIRRLVEIAEPQTRVWTNVGSAHLGHFRSVEEIARAKAEILEGADGGTLLVANAADRRVMAHAAGFPGRTVTFGVGVRADVAIGQPESLGQDGMRAVLSTADGEAAFRTPLLGEANLANIAAATAVALDCGVPFHDVVSVLETLTPSRGRGEVIVTSSGWTVIDDAYNSSPEALRRALQTLAEVKGRRVALLGEMLELGVSSDALHAECGRAAATAGLSLLVTVGGAPAEAMAAAAVEAGLPSSTVRHERSSATLAGRVREIVRPGDVVLVKGSRGIGMDRVVAALTGGEG
jgi:UDP-N-acetylmuramoyl-tripeptide--D-alanyl-D-alanine ligase